MAGTSNSITTHNVLSGVLNADNVISGLVNTAFNPAYALVTQAGAQIVLFINNNDYKMYAQLKDKSGNLIYTSNIIDLPLETMVVDGRYDSNTKKLILVLDNRNEIEVPLEALINGLVNEDDLIANYYDKDEIDALLDGYWTKIELTQEDIDNWNAANAAFESELFDDGVISIEDSTEANINNTMNKSQLKIGLKGNTSQYSTTGKNLLNISNITSGNGITNNGDGTITLNGTITNTSFTLTNPFTLKANKSYTLSLTNTYSNGSNSTFILRNGNTNKFAIAFATRTNTFTPTQDTVIDTLRIFGDDVNFSNYTFSIQLEENNQYTSYEPYTGGIPAPNPSYPYSVQVVSGDNTIKVEGKNLFQSIYIPVPSSTPNAVLKAGTYTIASCDGNNFGKNIYFRLLDENNNIITTGGHLTATGVTINFSTSSYSYYGGANTSYITFTIDNDYKVAIGLLDSDGTRQLMLVKGSEAVRNYTPYVSQTYPINLGSIELCKIGDYQDYIRKSTGKNLFDKDNANIIQNKYLNDSGVEISDNSFSISDYMKVDANTVYSNQPFENKNACICFYNSSKTFLSSKRLTQIEPNFTTPNNCEYIRVSIWKADINILQIEKSAQATSYEPYGKVWYLNKQIGKVVYTGSNEENWTKNTSAEILRYVIVINDCLTTSSRQIVLSNYYNYKDHSNYAGLIFLFNNNLYVYPDNINTSADFKTWLSTHNTTVYYILATPAYEEITDTTLISQLEAIKKSYNSQTNISQTNTDKPFILDVTALKDLEAEDTTPALTTNRGLLFTQPPVSENFINDEDNNSILEKTINEEEPNIEDDNREEEEPVDFFEKEIINNDEEQEEMPTEPIEIDNGQR